MRPGWRPLHCSERRQGETGEKVPIDPQTGKVVKFGAKDDDEEEDGNQNDEWYSFCRRALIAAAADVE